MNKYYPHITILLRTNENGIRKLFFQGCGIEPINWTDGTDLAQIIVEGFHISKDSNIIIDSLDFESHDKEIDISKLLFVFYEGYPICVKKLHLLVSNAQNIYIRCGGDMCSVKVASIGDIGRVDIFDAQNIEIDTNNFKLNSLYIQNPSKEIILNDSFIENIGIQGEKITKFECQSSIINNGYIGGFTEIKNINWNRARFNNIQFFNLNFPKNSTNFSISNTVFSENSFSNINWGDGIDIRSEDWIGIKEFYRNIKHEHDQIGNKTEANKFFAKEMEYYRKSLEGKDWDKIIVSWLQQYTNNYGNSWWLPIIWMLFIAYYAAFYKFCHIQESGTFWELFVKNILPISDIGHFYSFLDLLYKLTWAFLVYQFIVALRRISQR